MEHPNLMQQGHSMPERGPPSEWVSVPQASIAVRPFSTCLLLRTCPWKKAAS